MAGKFSALLLLALTALRVSFAWAEDEVKIQSLRNSHPQFDAALRALGDEDAASAIEKLKPLASSIDPSLAAEAEYFLARAYLLHEQAEEALPAFQRVLGEHAANSCHVAEARFFLGICQKQLLQRRAALATFAQFLKDHPAAPERMQTSARQHIASLRTIEDGALSDVQTRMEYVGRRLHIGHSGRRTQDEQKNIIAMLDKLMKEEPPHGPSPDDPPRGDPRTPGDEPGDDKPGVPRWTPGKPAPGPKGNHPSGEGGAETGDPDHPHAKVARRTSNARGDWSRVRNTEREAHALQALKQRFPARYQELVKEYYRSLAEDAD
jgi:tetratricopeptide (TPR) repeat protein